MDPNANPKSQVSNPSNPGGDSAGKMGITTPLSQQPMQPVTQPVMPVGGKKEAPVGMPNPSEWVAPSTPEIVLPKEVKDAGVESHPVIPQVSQDARQQGVQMSGQNIPAPHVTAEIIGMQTSPSVLEQLKTVHKSVKDSFSWLVRLIIREQKKEKNGGLS